MSLAVIPRYTRPMKTAISVPDVTYARVDKKAAELGMSRSQFYSVAAERYLRDLESEGLTARIDEALARSGEGARAEAHEWAVWSKTQADRRVEGDEW